MKNKKYDYEFNTLESLRTADIKFIELCNEVDSWRAEAEYWKQQYEDLIKEYSKHLKQTLKH